MFSCFLPPQRPHHAHALFDFTPHHPSQLRFLRGDVIELLDCSDSLRWKGRCHGHVGFFSPEYVQPIYQCQWFGVSLKPTSTLTPPPHTASPAAQCLEPDEPRANCSSRHWLLPFSPWSQVFCSEQPQQARQPLPPDPTAPPLFKHVKHKRRYGPCHCGELIQICTQSNTHTHPSIIIYYSLPAQVEAK